MYTCTREREKGREREEEEEERRKRNENAYTIKGKKEERRKEEIVPYLEQWREGGRGGAKG